MIVALILLSVAVLGLALELFRSRSTYEALYQVLLADRDAARAEVVTFRAALFPQLGRITAQPKAVQAAPTPPPKSNREGFLHLEGLGPRKPFRLRFRDLVRQHNTKQLGRDRMAAAVQSQPKDTPNA